MTQIFPKELDILKEWILKETSLNIHDKAKTQNLVYIRAIFYSIALKTLPVSLKIIALYMDKQRETIVHAIHNTLPHAMNDESSLYIFNLYFDNYKGIIIKDYVPKRPAFKKDFISILEENVRLKKELIELKETIKIKSL